jgi:hypothetical protein
MNKIPSLGALAILAAVLGIPAWAQAPSGLAVKGATSKKIDLTWSGVSASYTVQRRTLGGAFADLATVSTASYSDSSIDA